MSAVTVFVDDAVLGHLPMVGVTDGAPADGLHRIHQSIGGSSGWVFLLLFLGPIGWIALVLALAFGGSARQLVVRLPSTRAALDAEQRRFRAAVVAGLVMVAATIGWFVAFLGPTPRSNVRETLMLLSGAVAIGAVVATVVLAIRYSVARPGIELDASGRWVTLRNVHTAFVAACAESTPDRSGRAVVPPA